MGSGSHTVGKLGTGAESRGRSGQQGAVGDLSSVARAVEVSWALGQSCGCGRQWGDSARGAAGLCCMTRQQSVSISDTSGVSPAPSSLPERKGQAEGMAPQCPAAHPSCNTTHPGCSSAACKGGSFFSSSPLAVPGVVMPSHAH